MATGFGLGWVNAAADYSRYLPRTAVQPRRRVGWTTFGGALAPVVLLVFGILLAGSSEELSTQDRADPIGALTTLLPTWFLVPFAIVAVLGLVGGAVLDIYSSGLALLTLGLPVPRYVAAADRRRDHGRRLDLRGVLRRQTSSVPFQGFLITLGVPIAAWAGVFDRRPGAAPQRLCRRRALRPARPLRQRPAGCRSCSSWSSAPSIGWGLVTNTLRRLAELAGLPARPARAGWPGRRWAFANLGVFVAIAIGFVGHLVLGRARVHSQESFR